MIFTKYVEIKIRRMKIDDLPQVQDIDQLSFSSPWPKNAFQFELLENPNSHCWVAETDRVLVGFVVYWLIVDEVHIATIAVHPKYRGNRISRDLLIIGLGELISKGALMATLEVREGNIIAQQLYRHFGFEEVGLRKSYYQDTHEDAIMMTVKPLDSDYLNWLNSGAESPWQSNKPG